MQECIERVIKEKIICIYCLASSKYKEILEIFGFSFIVEKIELVHNNMNSFNYDYDNVEPAKEEDIPQIKKIAKNAFRGITRFYRDPNFSKKKVDNLYELWIDKFMKDKSSTIIIIKENNKIVAFNGISIKNGEGRIELIAIHKKYRNQGYGEKIMKFAQNYFMKNQVKNIGFQVRVSTQNNNIPALKFYKKMGYITNEKIKCWFHWWNKDILRTLKF